MPTCRANSAIIDFMIIDGYSHTATVDELKEYWEPKKEYIEKDLWVIRNFLSPEELFWLNKEANDPNEWYTTMRSPYGGNTKNKFLGYIADYDEFGNMLVPSQNSKYRSLPIPIAPIERRIESVVPKYFSGAGALQSFFEVSDEQIIAELGHNVDYAMGWHYERDDSDDDTTQRTIVEKTKTDGKRIVSQSKISGTFSVYINDNFDGGILKFKNKDYEIKPEAGMIVNVPLYKEFEHMVSKVTGGNRHTLYGTSWDNIDKRHISTDEDC